MKKTTIVLFVLAAIFAATSAFFALQNSDIKSENAELAKAKIEQDEKYAEVYDLRAKTKLAEDELEAVKTKNRELEKAVADAEDRAVKQQKAIEDADKKIAAQQKTIAEKDSEKKTAQEAAEKDKATIEELQKKLAEEHNRAEELNGEIVKMRSTQERKDFEAALAEKDEAIAALSQERESLEAELAARKMEIADLTQRLQAQQVTAQDRTAAADSRADEMSTELEDAKKEIQALTNEVIRLRRRLANY